MYFTEEILYSNSAHWWSTDNSFICYAQFDDTNVPLYRFPYYGKGSNIYGDIEAIAYPKAGDTTLNINPHVSLFVVETANTGVAQKQLKAPPEIANQ